MAAVRDNAGFVDNAKEVIIERVTKYFSFIIFHTFNICYLGYKQYGYFINFLFMIKQLKCYHQKRKKECFPVN